MKKMLLLKVITHKMMLPNLIKIEMPLLYWIKNIYLSILEEKSFPILNPINAEQRIISN